MKDSKNNDAESLSIYRYLMTIARRDGAEDVRVRLIVSDGSEIAVIRCGKNQHRLPNKSIDIDADGDELRDAVRYTAEDLGLDVSGVCKYLGSREADNCGGLTKYFDFEVLVKKKRTDKVRWLGKSDIDKLNFPTDERRILRGYFRNLSLSQ